MVSVCAFVCLSLCVCVCLSKLYVLKQSMKITCGLDSSNMCLCLLVLTVEPHFDVVLT